MLKRTGDIFGEMGIFDSSKKVTSIYAVNKATCLVTDISKIDQLLGDNRFILSYLVFRGFTEILANRLKQTTKALNKANNAIKKMKKK